MSNVQSIVTPATITPAPSKAKATKAKLNGSTTLTPAQAIETAYQYGHTMAGQDGALTNAFKTFAKDDQVIEDMVQALSEGYMVRKLGYDREEATRVISLKKYNQLNPSKNTDENRTAEQERIMTAIRVLVHRAKKMAGIGKPVDVAEREATRAAKEAEKEAHESRLVAADEIVNPPEDVNPFDALARLVLTMKSLANKHSAKLTGDSGMAWRDWLASAPINQPAPKANGKARK
jgi:hypothetical protein